MKRKRARSAGRAVIAAAVAGAALPATASADAIVVTSGADSGAGSLRAAVAAANADADLDSISFAGVSGTITLNGELKVTRPLEIHGPGSGALTIRQTSPNPVFLLGDTVANTRGDLSVSGLTLSGGSSGIEDSKAGGAITVVDSVITGAAGGGSGSAIGGYAASPVTVVGSTITGNTANLGAPNYGGGAIYNIGSPITVVDSTVADNAAHGAQAHGGAIYARGSAVTLTGSTVTGNQADADGGAVFIRDDTVLGRPALTVSGSRIEGNRTSGDGGAINVSTAKSPTVITGSTISGNFSPQRGAGLYFGYGAALSISDSTFAANGTAQEGGGMAIYAPSGAVTIANTTVTGNKAGTGAGIWSFGYYDKAVSIESSTVAANAASSAAGGIFRFGYDGSGPGYEGPDDIDLSSVIVAGNTAPASPDLAQGPQASGAFIAGHSVIGSTAGGAALLEFPIGSNALDAGDPRLLPLADNGGPTQTMLPTLASPAVDAGTTGGISADQRGVARPFDHPGKANSPSSDGADAGAAELTDADVAGAKLKAKRTQRPKGRKVSVGLRAGAAEDVTVSAAGTVALGRKRVRLKGPSLPVAGGATKAIKLKPKGKRAGRKIARLLARGRGAKVAIEATLTDQVGNVRTLRAKVKLRASK